MASLNRIRTTWRGVAGTPFYSNHYFVDDATLATAQDAVNAIGTFWSSLAGNISALLNYTVEADVARIDSVTGELLGNWTALNVTGSGTNAGEYLPGQVQGIVRWETSTVVAGHRLRGRTFIPGPTEPLSVAPGVPVVGYSDALTINANAVIADAGNVMVIWSPTHGEYRPVTGATGLRYWATLRSRRD